MGKRKSWPVLQTRFPQYALRHTFQTVCRFEILAGTGVARIRGFLNLLFWKIEGAKVIL